MKKIISVRMDENHPIWNEKNKTQVIIDALELYYATKTVINGVVKLNTIQPPALNNTSENETANLFKNKKIAKSFLDAFTKL